MWLLLLTLVQTDVPRPPHPLAPSLPQLTKEETAKYEKVVDRFILYDTGKLPGAAGQKALEDFNRLPPEAIFVLIDGFNQAANLEASCPAVIIGKKIGSILNRSNDLQLLSFAKDNVGLGVTSKRHQGMLKDLQFGILLRRGAVQRQLVIAGNQKEFSAPKFPASLSKQTPTQLKTLLRSDRPETKAAAAKEIAARKLPFAAELIGLLKDSDPTVHQAARAALKQLSGGRVDFGPPPEASIGDRETAITRWSEAFKVKQP